MKHATFGLRTKTMLGSLAPIAMAGLICVVSIASLRSILRATDRMVESAAAVEQIMEMDKASQGLAAAMSLYLLVQDQSALAAYESAGKHMTSVLKRLQQPPTNPSVARLAEKVEKHVQSFRSDLGPPRIERFKEAESDRPTDAFSKPAARMRKFRADLDDQFNKAYQREASDLKREKADSAGTANSAKVAVVILMASIVTIVVVKNFFMTRQTSRSLLEAVSFAEAISRGDLTRRMEIKNRTAEVGRLAAALNRMADLLKENIRQVMESVELLGSSASEVSTAVSQLSTGISMTTEAITMTSSAVEQMKQAAEVSSTKARSVAERSQLTVRISDSGKKATDDTLQKMGLIKERMESIGETVVLLTENARSIEEIIGSVQDLADQSNLLAVNASIEAARAGDQGKGFAVVAQEIKTLADRSRESTDKARSLLEDIRKSVDGVVMTTELGNRAVDQGVNESVSAGRSIQELASSVAESAQAADIIVASSVQQIAGVTDVSRAMTDLDQAMRQNLAYLTGLESAARKLADVGRVLSDLARKYRV